MSTIDTEKSQSLVTSNLEKHRDKPSFLKKIINTFRGKLEAQTQFDPGKRTFLFKQLPVAAIAPLVEFNKIYGQINGLVGDVGSTLYQQATRELFNNDNQQQPEQVQELSASEMLQTSYDMWQQLFSRWNEFSYEQPNVLAESVVDWVEYLLQMLEHFYESGEQPDISLSMQSSFSDTRLGKRFQPATWRSELQSLRAELAEYQKDNSIQSILLTILDMKFACAPEELRTLSASMSPEQQFETINVVPENNSEDSPLTSPFQGSIQISLEALPPEPIFQNPHPPQSDYLPGYTPPLPPQPFYSPGHLHTAANSTPLTNTTQQEQGNRPRIGVRVEMKLHDNMAIVSNNSRPDILAAFSHFFVYDMAATQPATTTTTNFDIDTVPLRQSENGKPHPFLYYQQLLKKELANNLSRERVELDQQERDILYYKEIRCLYLLIFNMLSQPDNDLNPFNHSFFRLFFEESQSKDLAQKFSKTEGHQIITNQGVLGQLA